MKCRFCNTDLIHTVIDLQSSPLANDFLDNQKVRHAEIHYPLRVLVCHNCYLVHSEQYNGSADIFNNEYAYYSSFSSSWVEHARLYTEMIVERFGYDSKSLVIEIASNDGYLLQHFVNKNIPVLGIEPSQNVATEATLKGIPTMIQFFGTELAHNLAKKRKKGNLIIGNNVIAHVPEINDFVEGLRIALQKSGVITLEFPHLMKLVEESQFDTIYHEHFSYFSLYTLNNIFSAHALKIFDVQEVSTHGGSLRIFAAHQKDLSKPISNNVINLLNKEEEAGVNTLKYYFHLQEKADKIRMDFLEFLIEQKKLGKKVIGYGAAAKGNTLLIYSGIKGSHFIEFVVDKCDFKQNKYLPGSHIPVVHEERIKAFKPDFIIIFPWNIKNEIMTQIDYVKDWGCQFVTFIPEKQLISLG